MSDMNPFPISNVSKSVFHFSIQIVFNVQSICESSTVWPKYVHIPVVSWHCSQRCVSFGLEKNKRKYQRKSNKQKIACVFSLWNIISIVVVFFVLFCFPNNVHNIFLLIYWYNWRVSLFIHCLCDLNEIPTNKCCFSSTLPAVGLICLTIIIIWRQYLV